MNESIRSESGRNRGSAERKTLADQLVLFVVELRTRDDTRYEDNQSMLFPNRTQRANPYIIFNSSPKPRTNPSLFFVSLCYSSQASALTELDHRSLSLHVCVGCSSSSIVLDDVCSCFCCKCFVLIGSGDGLKG